MLRTWLVLGCLASTIPATQGEEVPATTLAALGLADLEVQEVEVRSAPWQFHWGPCDDLFGCAAEPPRQLYTLPTLTFLRRRLSDLPHQTLLLPSAQR